MILRDELQRRCVSASERSLTLARECVLESLPDTPRFNLWLVPDWDANDQPRYAPEFAPFWNRSQRGRLAGLSLDEFITEIWHDGRAPEWVDLSVIDVHDDATVLEARFSRTLVTHFPASAPFNVRGPYIPPRLRARFGDVWPLPERWSLREAPHM